MQGTLKQEHHSVYKRLGGVSASDISTSQYTTITLSESIDNYELIRLNTSYYATGMPDYGGVTLSKDMLRASNNEPITVFRFDNSYRFNVKYISDTQLAVILSGQSSVNNCLSIHGIMT